jgi:hypothetical protein
MGQRQEDNIRLAPESFRVGFRKTQARRLLQMREPRVNFSERFAGKLPRCDRHQLDHGMGQQQPNQFLAGITRRAYHRDFGSAGRHAGSYNVFCRHNAQCVIRLCRIATNFERDPSAALRLVATKRAWRFRKQKIV